MKLEHIAREDWILVGVALLLVIDLLFLPWFDVSFSAGAFSASATFPATDTPDGWLGLLAVLATLAMIADVAVERLAPDTRVPTLGGSRTSTRLILTAAAGAFLALKFVLHIHFSIFGFGFYLAVLLAGALVVLAAQARQAAPITPGAVSDG